jgi:hypothetical protein
VWQFGLEDNERRTVLGGISRILARGAGGCLQ